MYLILSFDGGGIRGLFTATVLQRLIQHAPHLLDRVQLFAGTSTGGIIALALAAGIPVSQLIGLYRTRGSEIFDDSIWDNIADLGNAVGADYSLNGLKAALTQTFGARTLEALLPKNVLISSLALDQTEEIDDRLVRHFKPKFFHNFPGPDSDGFEKCVDVALRTAAAPTFFPSYQGYIDGGVVANNPAMAAVAQALDAQTGRQSLGDLHVLSIGTGINQNYIKTPPNGELNWGWGQWARPIISVMLDGVMGVTHYQCRRILSDRYCRIDTVLGFPANIDDVSDPTLERLQEAANRVNLTNAKAWLDKFVPP